MLHPSIYSFSVGRALKMDGWVSAYCGQSGRLHDDLNNIFVQQVWFVGSCSCRFDRYIGVEQETRSSTLASFIGARSHVVRLALQQCLLRPCTASGFVLLASIRLRVVLYMILIVVMSLSTAGSLVWCNIFARNTSPKSYTYTIVVKLTLNSTCFRHSLISSCK